MAPTAPMQLTITVPEEILLEADAQKVTAEGTDGSFCLLPNHIDFASPLKVGILSYVDPDGREVFVAVDRGILVKRGREVRVSVRRAVSQVDLADLEETVRSTYRQLSEEEMQARRAVAQLESSFVRRFLDLKEPNP